MGCADEEERNEKTCDVIHYQAGCYTRQVVKRKSVLSRKCVPLARRASLEELQRKQKLE